MQRVLLVVMLTGMLLGCDQRAAEQRAARAKLDKAVALLAEAELGFVPADIKAVPSQGQLQGRTQELSSGGKELDVPRIQQYRQAKLAEALKLLEPLTSSGTPAQQAGARRLIADVYASRAMHLYREALSAWTDVSNRSVLLSNYLIGMGRAQGRALAYRVDDASLQAKLLEYQRDHRKALVSLEEEAKRTDQSITALQQEIEKFQKAAEQARGEEAEIRRQALSATGQERYRLLDETDKSRRKALDNDREAQQRVVKRDILVAEQAIAAERRDFYEDLIEDLEKQVQQAASRTDEFRQEARKAQSDQQALGVRLEKELSELTERYTREVQEVFTQSVAAIDKSIEVLRQAASVGGGGSDRREIELELLTKQQAKVHILASDVMAAADMADKVNVLRQSAGRGGEAPMAQRMELLSGIYRRIREEQAQRLNDARTTLGDAMTVANSLTTGGAGDDPVVRDAAVSRKSLEEYNKRLDEMKIQ